LLLFALRKKLGKLELESLRKNLPSLAVMTLVAGLVAWASWRWWENSIGHQNLALKIGAVFVPAGIAGLVYWLIALAFKIPAARELVEFALARFKKAGRA
jgi:TRAP-type C4-dicarboxylate transport system permease small subunit